MKTKCGWEGSRNYNHLIEFVKLAKIKGYSIMPFDFPESAKLYDELDSLPKDIKLSLEDTLYLIMRDRYQQRFNQNPKKTIEEIRQHTKDKRIKPLATRVLEFYQFVYSFNIPGHGRLRD